MSETIPDLIIDKSTWGDGPWQNEPDREQWQHAGYACLIVRNDRRSGHLCGYVGIDESHPLFGKKFDVVDVDVHRGLTFAGVCQGKICHVAEPGLPEKVWWLGFDCLHMGDLSPGIAAFERSIPELARFAHLRNDTYRDIAYVRSETEKLAEQLRALATNLSAETPLR
jgi:hypothetical protein